LDPAPHSRTAAFEKLAPMSAALSFKLPLSAEEVL